MMPVTETDATLIRHLAGTVCACGRTKKAQMSHCRDCFYSLPDPQRRALYRRISSGYAEAYADSILTLKAKGRIKR